jgi:hypothetical protein
MRIIGSQLKKALNTATIALLAVSLAGCDFQESITPVSWPTVPPQPFQSGAEYGTPAPSPIPLAPSPSPPPPTPIPFQGADDLDCEGPIGGDDHFGYCSIPDSDLYYVWGECAVPCPDSEFPGIEIMVVADSSEYRDFTEVVRQRDTQLEKRGASSAWAAGLAGLDLLGAALGWETAKCIIGAEVTLGTSCIGFLVLVGGGLMAAGKEVADYLAADRELTRQGGLKEQATDKLADLRGQP